RDQFAAFDPEGHAVERGARAVVLANVDELRDHEALSCASSACISRTCATNAWRPVSVKRYRVWGRRLTNVFSSPTYPASTSLDRCAPRFPFVVPVARCSALNATNFAVSNSAMTPNRIFESSKSSTVVRCARAGEVEYADAGIAEKESGRQRVSRH